jgi:hypothetical protein
MLRKLSVVTLMLGLMTITPSMSIASPPRERCPNIDRAIHALEVAMHDMEVADHDFCGQKKEAMEATRAAIERLRRAKECDRCR